MHVSTQHSIGSSCFINTLDDSVLRIIWTYVKSGSARLALRRSCVRMHCMNFGTPDSPAVTTFFVGRGLCIHSDGLHYLCGVNRYTLRDLSHSIVNVVVDWDVAAVDNSMAIAVRQMWAFCSVINRVSIRLSVSDLSTGTSMAYLDVLFAICSNSSDLSVTLVHNPRMAAADPVTYQRVLDQCFHCVSRVRTAKNMCLRSEPCNIDMSDFVIARDSLAIAAVLQNTRMCRNMGSLTLQGLILDGGCISKHMRNLSTLELHDVLIKPTALFCASMLQLKDTLRTIEFVRCDTCGPIHDFANISLITRTLGCMKLQDVRTESCFAQHKDRIHALAYMLSSAAHGFHMIDYDDGPRTFRYDQISNLQLQIHHAHVSYRTMMHDVIRRCPCIRRLTLVAPASLLGKFTWPLFYLRHASFLESIELSHTTATDDRWQTVFAPGYDARPIVKLEGKTFRWNSWAGEMLCAV
jgi:hypothetical protein